MLVKEFGYRYEHVVTLQNDDYTQAMYEVGAYVKESSHVIYRYAEQWEALQTYLTQWDGGDHGESYPTVEAYAQDMRVGTEYVLTWDADLGITSLYWREATDEDLDTAFTAYVEAGIWLSRCNGTARHESCDGDDCDKGLDYLNYEVDDIEPATAVALRTELADFIADCIKERPSAFHGIDAKTIGHNFWLNRNGAGAGFWDIGYGEMGDWLSEASKPYGEIDFYVNEDGKLVSQ